MSEKKHIDRIFQEKLKDLDVNPGEGVWDKISQELGKKDRNRKVIPIWWKLAGIAAALLLLVTVGNFIFNQDDPLNNVPVIVNDETSEGTNSNSQNESAISPKEEVKKIIINSENTPEKNSDPNNSLVESDNPANSNSGTNANKKSVNTKPFINNSTVLTNQDKIVDGLLGDKVSNISKPSENIAVTTKEKEINDVQNQNALVNTDKDIKNAAIENRPEEIINNNSPENLIVEQEKEKIPLTEDVIVNKEDINEEEKEKLNRWQVSPNFAPVYFNAFGDGSSINEQLVYNDKSGDINLSYGVNVSYAVNGRLTVRSGVNRVNLGYSTNDVLIYENIGAASGDTNLFRNIKLNSAVQSLSFVSGSNLGFVQSPSIFPGESMAFLNQDMTFIEIPVELKYRMSDKKVGFSVVGGFSTFFLSNNEVSYELRGDNTILGEATNINDVSYSANFGFGLDYKFSKNMSFNVDPVFKYQISTFNNTSGSFKPYFIGVYSGINIKF